jgi:hypothetical protein
LAEALANSPEIAEGTPDTDCPRCGGRQTANVHTYEAVDRRRPWRAQLVCGLCGYVSEWARATMLEHAIHLAGLRPPQVLPQWATVVWEVTGKGARHERTGLVLCLLPPGADDANLLPRDSSVSLWQMRWCVTESALRRYLVRVERQGRDGRVLKPWFYTPSATTLEKATAEIAKADDDA